MLREAILSLLLQTVADWECLIYNDGGPDVGDIVAEFQDERLVYLQGERNLGFPLGYNAIMDSGRVRGKYISYVDDDDIAQPRKLAVMGGYLDRFPQVGLVYSDIAQTRNGHVVNYWSADSAPGRCHFSPDKLMAGSFIQPLRVMHRHYDYVRWSDVPVIAGDWLYMKALFNAGVQFSYLPQILGVYRWHSTPGVQNNSGIRNVTY